MSYEEREHGTLARLVPEVGAFGRDVKAQMGIDEWVTASPVHTARMRAA